jgi:HEAT repeat protein
MAVPSAALTTQGRPPLDQPTASEPDRLTDALARPFSERLPPPDSSRVAAGSRAALAGPDSALARLLVGALDRTPEHEADLVAARAAWALAHERNGRLVEPLLQALGDRDWRVRSYAAWALAPARDSRAVPLLIPLLAHPVWRLRAMAAHALRESADPRAEPAMTAALTDRAWQVRVEAVGYVAALGGPEAARRLRPRLDDRHVAVRLAAGAALTTP